MARPDTVSWLAIALLTALSVGCGSDGGRPDPVADAGDAATDAGVETECSPNDPRTVPPEPFIGHAGLRARVVAAFDGATTSLDVATYILDDAPILDALERAHERGVTVRVLLDAMRSETPAALDRLRAAGIDARTSSPMFTHYHPKIALIDGEIGIVMSANLNGYSMESERNHGVVLRDRRDVDHLASVFAVDYAGEPADLECTRLVLSPNNSRERIEVLVAGATSELRLQQLSLTDEGVRARIAERADAGVRVRVILADPAWIESNTESAAALRASGAEVRFLSVPENHAKLIVADEVAFVGSENLTWTSLERNREVGVLVSEPDAAGPLIDAFETDWAAASP